MLIEKNDNPQIVNTPLYPRLMIHKKTETVILFTDRQRGIVVHTGNAMDVKLGEIYRWRSSDFIDYTGTITLSNN